MGDPNQKKKNRRLFLLDLLCQQSVISIMMARRRSLPSASSSTRRTTSSIIKRKCTCTQIKHHCFWIAFAIIFLTHRYASYRENTKTLMKAPINDIPRICPPTGYPTIGIRTEENSTATTTTSSTITTGIDPGNICVTTLTDSQRSTALHRFIRWRNFDNLLAMTWPNKAAYCNRYGYRLFDESATLDTSRPPSWSKIKAVKRLLLEESCEWVFWMDADTVIMNSNKRIEDFLPADNTKDLILTVQKGGSYNAGAWLIRNSAWSLQFLNTWWSMKSYVHPPGLSTSGDNDALKAFLLNGMNKTYFDAHIVVPPRCHFVSIC